MAQYKHLLTHEALAKKFPSLFHLVGHAIMHVQKMARSGRPPRVHSEIQNPAVIVVEEIMQGKDTLEDLPGEIRIPETTSALQKEVMAAEEEEQKRDSKRDEKKKMRRLTEKV